MDWAQFIRPCMNAIIALRCLGYSLDDPQVIRAMDEFEKLGIEEETTPSACSPASLRCGTRRMRCLRWAKPACPRNDPRMVKAADWMLQKQVRTSGDWAVKNKKGQPAGWYFEFNNEFYPDVDDTARFCWRLAGRASQRRYQYESVQRAIDWMLSHAVQKRRLGVVRQRQRPHGLPAHSVRRPQRHARSADGGYYGTHPGDAGRLWILAQDKRVEKAIEFIREEQEPDGSWFGRWGVNYIYGTMQVLRGLEAMGVDHHEPYVQQAAEWLRMVQNPDGGWGETCGSYDDPSIKGVGAEHAIPDGLGSDGIAGGRHDIRSDSVARGIAYLLRTQKKTDRGTSRLLPGPVFRACSIWRITCTGSIFRCSR